jgi:hypothetical protein
MDDLKEAIESILMGLAKRHEERVCAEATKVTRRETEKLEASRHRRASELEKTEGTN